MLSLQISGQYYWVFIIKIDYHKINGHATGTDLLEVPNIYKAYVLGLCKRIYPQNMALYGTVPPF